MAGLLNLTLGQLLDEKARLFPDTDCVVYNDRAFRTTYKEFSAMTDLVGKGLMKLGIGKGDHVTIWATNVPEWMLSMFSCAKIGAVLVTMNTNYKTFEAEYLLKQSDTHTLVLIDGFKDCSYTGIINELVPEMRGKQPGEWTSDRLPQLKNVIHVRNANEKAFTGDNTGVTLDGMLDWDTLYEMGKEVSDEALHARQADFNEHDVVNMQYTSGTTGFPKGVMLTHYNIVNDGLLMGDCMKFTEKDRLCITVPLFHCFGCVLGVMTCMTHATTMVMVEYFSPVTVMKAISDENCTAFHGVPTMFITILGHADFEKYDFSHLRTGIMAGSPCPIAVMQEAVDRMNVREITSVFGLTEASPGCTQTRVTDPLELRVSTVGQALPFIECKVVDPETGLECPPNVPGEFMAKGFNIMKGYYNMPEATAAAIEDGWLHSGDIATKDENGYYRITGRIKDMIIRGGENIYPKELEEFLYTHPKVSDVQVIGVPSRQYGEEVLAYIIPKKGEDVNEEEIRAYFRANMSRHKMPKYIRFTDSFAMTASGKIQKYKLREQAVEELGLQNEVN